MRVGPRLARAPSPSWGWVRRHTTRPPPRRASVAAVRAGMSAPSSTEGLAGELVAAAEFAALGGDRRALPGLHQLHARLPDVLLHERQPDAPTWTAIRRLSRATLGQLLHARLRARRGRQLPHAPRGPLPTVADAQVRDLVGPVRQFSGCVGCGRCITWCPVGIDVREELVEVAATAPLPETPAPPNVLHQAEPDGRAANLWPAPRTSVAGAGCREAPRDGRYRHPAPRHRRSRPTGRAPRSVRHGRPAGGCRAAHLRIAFPA